MSEHDDTTHRDEWNRIWNATRTPDGPRDFGPRHRPIQLYHKTTSEDGTVIYDPDSLESNDDAWAGAFPGVAVPLPDLR